MGKCILIAITALIVGMVAMALTNANNTLSIQEQTQVDNNAASLLGFIFVIVVALLTVALVVALVYVLIHFGYISLDEQKQASRGDKNED
jgi:heme/copper-type cytochrome/quinol oxidase subunit 2